MTDPSMLHGPRPSDAFVSVATIPGMADFIVTWTQSDWDNGYVQEYALEAASEGATVTTYPLRIGVLAAA